MRRIALAVALLPWPSMLPPQSVPASVQPHGVPHCRKATVHCTDDLIRRLRRQWRGLDAACDHRALFSIAYLRITQGLRDYPFQDKRWMRYVIGDFSNHYFQYFRDYALGRPVPGSWKIAYDEAMHGDANGGQDVLLASNAHTQHDLPFIYAEMGMVSPKGKSHKPDHDAVNDVNERVFDGLEDYYADHYDSIFTYIDLKPSPLDEIGTQEMVQSWREGAWRNAERLINAKTAEERQQIADQIEQGATLWAQFITRGDVPGYRATRDAYCRSKH
ncbi:MAG: hypothetical protein QOJ29_1426 [Thermoleophilaceae bacterium]|jgi:hypothetical protein|nr:hypothetical protein [Thermoleophilaceae bacterium]